MNVNARTSIIVRNDPGCKAWSVFDVRQTGPQFIAAFSNREKASIFAACRQKQEEAFGVATPYSTDPFQVWLSAMICIGEQKSEGDRGLAPYKLIGQGRSQCTRHQTRAPRSEGVQAADYD
jgi:hypothetical protein